MDSTAAVFLDRDGTINEEVGYLNSLDKLRMIPGTFEAIRLINQSGLKAVVISNQSGVARGYFDEALVEMVHARIQALLNEHGAWIDRFYWCPHHPTQGIGAYRRACLCRKPEAGLILRAVEEMDIDLARSYMVGDMPKDIEAARKAGVKGILVKTGYGEESLKSAKNDPAANFFSSMPPDYVAADILDAAKWIMKDREP